MIVTPVCSVRRRGGRHHPDDVRRPPSGSGHDLDHASPDRCPGDPLLDVADEHGDQRIGLVDQTVGAMELEVEREHVRRVVAGGGHQVQRDPCSDRRDERYRATESRDGQVDQRPDPRRGQRGQVADRAFPGLVRVEGQPWNGALQLEIADEDVLVDQRRPEIGPVHRAQERRDGAHRDSAVQAVFRLRRACPRSNVPDARRRHRCRRTAPGPPRCRRRVGAPELARDPVCATASGRCPGRATVGRVGRRPPPRSSRARGPGGRRRCRRCC